MGTGKSTPENIITGLFIMVMGSVFLLRADGYETISDGKYTMFLIVCGGYCAVMLFAALQRFAMGYGSGGAEQDQEPSGAGDPEGCGTTGAAGLSAAARCERPRNVRNGGQLPVSRPLSHRRLAPRAAKATRAAALIYIALTLISALCSDYFPKTILGSERHEGTLTIAIYGLTFIFVSMHYRPRLLHLAVFAASTAAFDVISLMQTAGMDPFGLYPNGLTWADRNVKYSGEFIGTIGNADLVSAFLCIAIPLTAVMGVFLISDKRRRADQAGCGPETDAVFCCTLSAAAPDYIMSKNVIKVLTLAVGVLCIISAALSIALLAVIKVSAGIVATVFVVAIAAPVAAAVYFNGEIRKIIAAYLAAIVIAVCAAGAFIYAEPSLPGTAGELHEIMHGNIDDSFGTSRVYIYRNILERVPEHIMLGTGPDTIGYMDIEPFRRYSAERGVMITARIDTAHSEFLNVLACQGAPALGAYAAFAAGVLAAALRGIANCAAAVQGRWGSAAAVGRDVGTAAAFARPGGGAFCRDAAAIAAASAALALSATAYLVQSMFSFSSCATAPYFWISCAILIRLNEMEI